MKRHVVALVSLGALLSSGLSAARAADDDQVSGIQPLSGHNAVAVRIASDAQGRSTAAWVEQDNPQPHTIDPALWRVRVATRSAGDDAWQDHTWISATGAKATYLGEGDLAAVPRLAVAVAPNGGAVVAWVQTSVDGPRVQIATRKSFTSAFTTPHTLVLPTAQPACAVLSDVVRLQAAVDDAGGHLTYLDRCQSGSTYRRAVAVSTSGSIGAVFTPGVVSNPLAASIVRQGGATRLIAKDLWSSSAQGGGTLRVFELAGGSFALGRSLVSSTPNVVGGAYESVPVGADTIATAAVVQDGGTNKIVLDVDSGSVGADQVVLDPVPDAPPMTPRIAVAPDGGLAAVWLEGQQVWTAVRPAGRPWSDPAAVTLPVDEGTPVQGTLGVTARSGGLTHVVLDLQKQIEGVTQFQVFGSTLDPASGTEQDPATFSPAFSMLAGHLYPDLAGQPDGSARVVAPGGNLGGLTTAVGRDILGTDDVPPTTSGRSISRTSLGIGSTYGRTVLKKRKTSVAGRTYASDLKVGTRLTWTASEPATAAVTVQHVGCVSTRLVGRPKQSLAKCDKKKLKGTVYSRQLGLASGSRSWTYLGQVAKGKKLAAGGRYRITIRPSDASGNVGDAITYSVVIDGARR